MTYAILRESGNESRFEPMASDASQRQPVSDVTGGREEGFRMRETITLDQSEAPETHTFRGLN
jgi:hypothetical protein